MKLIITSTTLTQEGDGKTILVRRLNEALLSKYNVNLTREPGDTPIGDAILSILADVSEQPPCDRSEALLFQASRA